MKETAEQRKIAAWVGIDWADEEHAICLTQDGSTKREEGSLKQQPGAIDGWASELRSRFAGQKIAVCLEQTKGALIYALMKYDFFVLYPINPKQLSRYREALGPSGAKSDPRDAELLLDFVMTHNNRLRRWQPDDEQTRLIAMLGEDRRQLIDLRTELTNRLKSRIKQYFPQALPLVANDLTSRLACDFLVRWTTLEQLQRTDPEEIRRFYYGHNSRRPETIAARLELIRQTVPLTTDQAVIQSAVIQVRALAGQLRELIKPINEYDKQLAALMKQHPDAAIFESLPGAGDVMAPRLLSVFGTDRERFEDASEVQRTSGIAPVTQQSGKLKRVHRRWACSKFLRQTFHEYAGHSYRKSEWARAYYQMQRDRGKSHHTAIRALAFKWIRIITRCWKSRTLYDEATYIKSLERSNSPILKYLQPEQ